MFLVVVVLVVWRWPRHLPYRAQIGWGLCRTGVRWGEVVVVGVKLLSGVLGLNERSS